MTSWTAIFDDDEELGELLDLALGDNDAIAAASAAHKRRMAAAAAAIFPQEGGQGPGGKKEKVKEFSWGEHVRRLTETQFQRRYRLNWRSFYKLLKIIDADLTVTDMKQAKRGHFGWVVPNEAKLAMALRYLAGGDPKDLFLIYHVSYAYVFKRPSSTPS